MVPHVLQLLVGAASTALAWGLPDVLQYRLALSYKKVIHNDIHICMNVSARVLTHFVASELV